MKLFYTFNSLLALGSAQVVYQGFNYGASLDGTTPKVQSNFHDEFTTAQALANSPGLFNSVRLFTCIQFGTIEDPSEAFAAAIATNTSILVGMWASGTTTISKEINALARAHEEHGDDLARLIVGISVGSEDMYRASESGVRNNAGVGAGPDLIVEFIQQVREQFSGGSLSSIPIGHVDSWSAWTNTSNRAVIEAVDFLGTDIYPYYEDDRNNTFANAVPIFEDLYSRVVDAAGPDKEVWITETGWPYSGPDFGDAQASLFNAKGYWDAVACKYLGQLNMWWFTLEDDNTGAEAKFGITEINGAQPRFNLTCPPGSPAPAAINVDLSGSMTDPTENGAVRRSEVSRGLIVGGAALLGAALWL
jgi:glucan endo-1,3-beta-D-glucosidase